VVRSTITSKGQTTVPREVRDHLGAGPGDVLVWDMVEGTVQVTVANRAFLARRGSITVRRGSITCDIRAARG
jgi:AbrB family looped-hinge helix DNA binding protein